MAGRAPGPPTGPRTTTPVGGAVRWQVFGLVGVLIVPTGCRFPSRSSVLMTPVVPTHRCGAVPDFHRVPSYEDAPGEGVEPTASTTIYGNNTVVTTPILCFPASRCLRPCNAELGQLGYPQTGRPVDLTPRRARVFLTRCRPARGRTPSGRRALRRWPGVDAQPGSGSRTHHRRRRRRKRPSGMTRTVASTHHVVTALPALREK